MNYNIINVVDIEATCWDKEESKGNTSEIIEIGISELNIISGNIISSESVFVTPNNSKVSEYCYNLTGISQKHLDFFSIHFSKSCEILKKHYDSNNRVWASYGNYDKRMFENQCYIERLKYPFGDKHINVKTLFALKYKLNKEVGMKEALEILNIPLEGKHHSGKDDAKNIAKILAEVLK